MGKELVDTPTFVAPHPRGRRGPDAHGVRHHDRRTHRRAAVARLRGGHPAHPRHD